MKQRFSWLFGPAAAALLTLGVAREALAGDGLCAWCCRGCAILPPLESPDCPSANGAAPNDIGTHGAFYPYYSPVIPSSVRWLGHGLVPYYPGFCPKSFCHTWKCGGACDGPWHGDVPIVLEWQGGPAGTYGAYTGAPRDEAFLLHLGGGGPAPHLVVLPEAKGKEKAAGQPSRGKTEEP
jgi:hypothetical protein